MIEIRRSLTVWLIDNTLTEWIWCSGNRVGIYPMLCRCFRCFPFATVRIVVSFVAVRIGISIVAIVAISIVIVVFVAVRIWVSVLTAVRIFVLTAVRIAVLTAIRIAVLTAVSIVVSFIIVITWINKIELFADLLELESSNKTHLVQVGVKDFFPIVTSKEVFELLTTEISIIVVVIHCVIVIPIHYSG